MSRGARNEDRLVRLYDEMERRRRHARGVMARAGVDPDRWRDFVHDDDTPDRLDDVRSAAWVLRQIQDLEEMLAVLWAAEDVDLARGAALEGLWSALGVGWFERSADSAVSGPIVQAAVPMIDERRREIEAGRRGGAGRADHYAERNLEMAREHQDRYRHGAGLSSTALAIEIGARHGLSRTPAIIAVQRGYERLGERMPRRK